MCKSNFVIYRYNCALTGDDARRMINNYDELNLNVVDDSYDSPMGN